MHLNHLETAPSTLVPGKIAFHEASPWCQKIGEPWFTVLVLLKEYFHWLHFLFVQLLICYCYCSFAKSCLALCNSMNYSMPGSLSSTTFQSLLRFMSIESMMLSNHLILCHPLLLLPSLFPSIKVSSKESALPIRWPKYWSFSFSINPPNEYSGLISFRIDLIWSPCVFSSTTAWKHQFFSAQPTLWSNSHNPTWLLAKP